MAATSEIPHWTTVDWSPSVRELVRDGRRLRYVDHGEGPPLVLIHGLGGAWQWWLENIPTLSREHRVIAVDLPGFGGSDALPVPAEMAAHADAVLALIEALELEPVTLVGHSMGGLVSLAIAAAQPDRVARIVLVNAGGVPMTARRLAVVIRVLTGARHLLARPSVVRLLIRRPRLRRLLVPGNRQGGPLSAQLASEIVPLLAATGFLDAVAAAGRAVAGDRPAGIDCPVLLLWGDRDPIVPLAAARQMAEELPDATLAVIEGIGHSPMVEAPARFNEELLAFTRRTATAAPGR